MRLLKIGRDASNDIVLHSDKVSSLHAELTMLDSGDIQIEDKNSRNGTFIMKYIATAPSSSEMKFSHGVPGRNWQIAPARMPMIAHPGSFGRTSRIARQ